MTSRDTYVAKMKLQLDELNDRLSEMEAKAKVTRAEVSAGYRADMERLHAQSREAVGKLEELRQAGEDSWESLVAEADKLRQAFSHAFSDFQTHMAR